MLIGHSSKRGRALAGCGNLRGSSHASHTPRVGMLHATNVELLYDIPTEIITSTHFGDRYRNTVNRQEFTVQMDTRMHACIVQHTYTFMLDVRSGIAAATTDTHSVHPDHIHSIYVHTCCTSCGNIGDTAVCYKYACNGSLTHVRSPPGGYLGNRQCTTAAVTYCCL